jgi:hypothetical protein
MAGLTVRKVEAGPRRPAGGYSTKPMDPTGLTRVEIKPMATARPISVTPVKPGRRAPTKRPVLGRLGLAKRTIMP